MNQYRLVFIIFILIFSKAQAQVDTLTVNKYSPFQMKVDHLTSSKLYRMTCVSVPLIAGGLIVKSENDHFRSLRNDYFPHFANHLDNYMQYLPAALLYGLKLGNVEGRSSWGRMLTSHAFSTLLMTGAVNALKSTTKVMRPDGTSRTSFPSGHTATAFMTATMLDKEYGSKSPWYSIGGYTIATATGLFRMANNRHWLSDIMVGAGIGILSADIGYLLTDLIFKDKGIHHYPTEDATWDENDRPSFLGLYMGFNIPLQRFSLSDGSEISAKTGSNSGLEGAWFFNRYMGLGGRFTISNFQFTLNGVPQNSSIDMLSGYGGAYFSYPITARWLIGSKLLIGYNHYSGADLPSSEMTIGNKNGAGFGTGISFNYRTSERLSMKIFTDYNILTPSFKRHSEAINMLTLGASMNVIF